MPGMGTETMAGSLYSVDMIHKECLSPPARLHLPWSSSRAGQLRAHGPPSELLAMYSVWDAYFRSFPSCITLVCDEHPSQLCHCDCVPVCVHRLLPTSLWESRSCFQIPSVTMEYSFFLSFLPSLDLTYKRSSLTLALLCPLLSNPSGHQSPALVFIALNFDLPTATSS